MRPRQRRRFHGERRVCGAQRQCSMAADPTVEDEDTRRQNRERNNLIRIRGSAIASRESSPALAFSPSSPICAKLQRSWKVRVRRKECPCRKEAEPSCAVIPPGFTCCLNKPMRSNRNGCDSSRSFRPRTRVRSQWFAFLPALSASHRDCGPAGERNSLTRFARSESRRPLRRTHRRRMKAVSAGARKPCEPAMPASAME